MTKLKTIIVDDESLALRLLRSVPKDFPEIELVAECENGRQALAAVMEHSPDLMFLDIQMPGMTGFDVIKSLQADVVPMVIFATAYDRYAIDAFEVNAVDYVLKPIDEDELARAVERAVDRFEMKEALHNTKQHMLEALGQMSGSSASDVSEIDGRGAGDADLGYSEKLAIKDGGEINFVATTDIDWVDAAGDYMCVHSNGVIYVMRSTIKELLAQLDPQRFMRIHRSTIVSMSRIKCVIHHRKGEYFVDLKCGERLKSSRTYTRVIKNFIAQ